jgi:RHH-type proline utilization regulon transcriptional repressor/proline dehydrogenase/delta 1-pyrroline-5-carboxylate dehydrogenase
LPRLVVPLIVAKLRHETQHVIVPAEEEAFRAYLQQRREDGMRLNINQLGEAILGEAEAQRRLQAYLNLLSRPDIEYISVKISSIFSQINLVAFEATVADIKARLRTLYRQAMQYEYARPDGRRLPKFVNLDMEEYRDLRLTVAAFTQVLDEPEFLTHRAGIVLQAYLPDAATVQRELTAWALRRVERGGAPIKVRLVKGANLAMERVEAARHGWEQAPYHTKAEVDANYKRMVAYGMQPEHIQAVHLGIASHNLFDVAYALLLRNTYGLQDDVEFEMLEGMANHQARAVHAHAGSMLLYAPVVKREDFHSAIAYFVRRLDENTAEDNFLRDLFGLEVGSASWHKQRDVFLHALQHMDTVRDQPRRTQNRQVDMRHFDPGEPFRNEPDTDWSLPHHQTWIRAIRDTWQQAEIASIPLQIGGELIPPDIQEQRLGKGHDPSRPDTIAYHYALATREHIDQALDVARRATTSWASTPISARKAVLVAGAAHLARHRGDLIGAMMLDGGKSVVEADAEVSEAIDFANYYARSLDLAATALADCTLAPFGVVLVTPPWNFPLAIPCGGILAALMAGNTVMLKPAPEAVLVGWKLCQVLWEAGIPKEVLQFVQPLTTRSAKRWSAMRG